MTRDEWHGLLALWKISGEPLCPAIHEVPLPAPWDFLLARLHTEWPNSKFLPAFLLAIDPEKDFAETWPNFVLSFVVPAIREDSLGDTARPSVDRWQVFYKEGQHRSPAYRTAAEAVRAHIVVDLGHFARKRKNRTRLYAAMMKAIKEAT